MGFSALIGGVASIGSSLLGASAQSDAAQQAQDTQMNMYNQTKANLQPFVDYGKNSISNLQSVYDQTSKPFNMTQQQLEQTPGYQFQLQQGLESVQNSYAAQGLANSGVAMKGAANYAEGLASSNYQQQFQNYLTQNQQLYNQAYNNVGLGENAAATLGTNALQTGQGVAQTQASLGNALAGAANNAGTGITNAVNQYAQYNYLNNNSSMQGVV